MRKVIMFDYDGVIVDSLDAFCSAAAEAFRAVHLEQYANSEAILAFHEQNWFDGMAAAGISAATGAAIEDHIASVVDGNENLQPFAGIAEVISTLAKDATLMIITSSRKRVVESFLRAHDIVGITRVIGSDDETSKIAKIGLARAEYGADREYWYVGDTVGDILEGSAAGVHTIAVSWGWHRTDRLLEAQPDRLADDPLELLCMLKQ
jgi:phosphoglycolate phosphatase